MAADIFLYFIKNNPLNLSHLLLVIVFMDSTPWEEIRILIFFFPLILVLSVGKCQENEKLVPSSQFWLGHSL